MYTALYRAAGSNHLEVHRLMTWLDGLKCGVAFQWPVRYLWHAYSPVTKIPALYWPTCALQNYLKLMKDLMILSGLQHWRQRLTCYLSLLNCLVILPRQQRIKKQRWPTNVPLYLSVSKTTSLPSLLSPPVSATQWKSGKDSSCRVTNTTQTRARPQRWEGTALWPKTLLMIHSLHR